MKKDTVKFEVTVLHRGYIIARRGIYKIGCTDFKDLDKEIGDIMKDFIEKNCLKKGKFIVEICKRQVNENGH